MNSAKLNNYFDILELPASSSWGEVRSSYSSLKELYSTSSIVTIPMEDHWTTDRREEILEAIEEAYNELEFYFQNAKKKNEDSIKSLAGQFDFINGNALKKIREGQGIDLLEISLSTSIQLNHLKNIEEENFSALPRDIYTRGYVVSLAKHLGIDPKNAADDYMQAYHEWSSKQSAK